MAVIFQNNIIRVTNAMNDACITYLYDAGMLVEGEVKLNCEPRIDTGQTRSSWQYIVDEEKLQVTIGNPLQNAIWEEFGTGEYALHHNGRKGGWVYMDNDGKYVFTKGKTPHRPFERAYNALKNILISMAEQVLKGRFNGH